MALSRELSTKERDLKSSISPRIAEVIKDKRICLLERLLNEAGHEDIGLVEDIKRGFDLTGALPRSGVFNQKFRPTSMTCEDLRKVSNLSRDVLLESVQSSGDRETDVSLFEATIGKLRKASSKGSSAKIFKQCVLPFGSIASVTAFLRVSLALWKVGSTLLHLMWSVNFDDFLCLARNSESKHVDFCVDALFSLLGWRISKNKLLDFSALWKVLEVGVQLDLRQSGDKLCFVTNTEDRVEELVNELDEALRTKILSRSEGEKLIGEGSSLPVHKLLGGRLGGC